MQRARNPKVPLIIVCNKIGQIVSAIRCDIFSKWSSFVSCKKNFKHGRSDHLLSQDCPKQQHSLQRRKHNPIICTYFFRTLNIRSFILLVRATPRSCFILFYSLSKHYPCILWKSYESVVKILTRVTALQTHHPCSDHIETLFSILSPPSSLGCKAPPPLCFWYM